MPHRIMSITTQRKWSKSPYCQQYRVIHGLKLAYLNPKEEGNDGHFLKHCTELGYGKTRKGILGILELTAEERGFLTLS